MPGPDYHARMFGQSGAHGEVRVDWPTFVPVKAYRRGVISFAPLQPVWEATSCNATLSESSDHGSPSSERILLLSLKTFPACNNSTSVSRSVQ